MDSSIVVVLHPQKDSEDSSSYILLIRLLLLPLLLLFYTLIQHNNNLHTIHFGASGAIVDSVGGQFRSICSSSSSSYFLPLRLIL